MCIRVFLLLLLSLLSACNASQSLQESFSFSTGGRVQIHPDGSLIDLISAGSYVELRSAGGNELVLKLEQGHEKYGWYVLELDGVYAERGKVLLGAEKKLKVPKGVKTARLYKATEASNAEITVRVPKNFKMHATPKKKKIEFIGDSITSGMGNDTTIACGSENWYDQHNAYYSYAAIAARMVGADFLLSSVSGMGMYRNWNTEYREEDSMPEVYQYLHLSRAKEGEFDNSFAPDVVVIALGTNDLSRGDGSKFRKDFDYNHFVRRYREFLELVSKKYPLAEIVLSNSPMLHSKDSELLQEALNEVRASVDFSSRVHLFRYENIVPTGCGYHPSIAQDQQMALQISPLLNTLLYE